MEYSEQLKYWINETTYYYLHKMHSKHWANHDLNVILDREYMQLLEEGWDEWANEHGFEPFEPIPYDVNNDGTVRLGTIYTRLEDGKYFILMWLNIRFHNNLTELQHTIVHELIHLVYNIEHGPLFEALTDMYQLPTMNIG